MMSLESERAVFGLAPAGVACHPRSAAYVVIPGPHGGVGAIRAIVRGRTSYWLTGGGRLAGESPEETIAREVREELGRAVRLAGRIGEAIQFFYAHDEECWFEMAAVFFKGDLEEESLGPGEHELNWLDASRQGHLFFHACHVWAASKA